MLHTIFLYLDTNEAMIEKKKKKKKQLMYENVQILQLLIPTLAHTVGQYKKRRGRKQDLIHSLVNFLASSDLAIKARR